MIEGHRLASRFIRATAPQRRAVLARRRFEHFTYPELFVIASTDFHFEDTLTDIAYVPALVRLIT